MIWELALNARDLGMKRIIIMIWGLGLPTGTIEFWGTHVQQILTVDKPLSNIGEAFVRSFIHPFVRSFVVLSFILSFN